MKLERAQELYTDYAEGTLSPSLRLALEQHWAADPASRADFERFQKTLALLDAADASSVEVPVGFRARVLEMAAQEKSARENTPARRALLSLTGWFHVPGPRRATGGALAALAAAAIAGVFFFHSPSQGPKHPVIGAGLVPGIGTLNSAVPPSVIRSVSMRPGQDGNTYHYFDIHLPSNIPHATVTAYVVTATDQITDPTARAASATPALAQPQPLASDEDMQLPVALLRQPPAGTTLNVLVTYTPDDASIPAGTDVIFTPAPSVASVTSAPISTDAGSLYDALQSISAAAGVTVIASVPQDLPTPVAPTFTNGTPEDALKAVAVQSGMKVYTLGTGNTETFLVSADK